MKRLAYIAALSAVMFAAAAHHRPAYSSNTREHLGAHLPRWSAPLEENRFRSPWTWDQTTTWFDRNYSRAQFPRITIVNMPGVKAIHVANRSGSGNYSGINIYEMRDGEVRFYVLPKTTDS